MNRPSLLVFGWGNRSRGDDALGPLFVERLLAWSTSIGIDEAVEFLDDYQLQPEHALDLCGRSFVLFVDASLGCETAFELRTLAARRDRSFTSHALSPESLLQVFLDVDGGLLPECDLLMIGGNSFELGAPPSQAALHNLDLAIGIGQQWLLERVACNSPPPVQRASGLAAAVPEG